MSFQSTRPGWGGTKQSKHNGDSKFHFNPPAPGGAGRDGLMDVFKLPIFQSTRPGWGGTTSEACSVVDMAFQSTRPGWGGTSKSRTGACLERISIHPPRVGRDSKRAQK